MVYSSITLARLNVGKRKRYTHNIAFLFTGTLFFAFLVELLILGNALLETVRISAGIAVIGVISYLCFFRIFSATSNDKTRYGQDSQ